MQRMPSSLRSKIQSGSLKRSSVSTAFIASAAVGARRRRERARARRRSAPRAGRSRALLVASSRATCSIVRPLLTDSGCVLSGLRRASAPSSRRLISSHCGFAPPSVRCSVQPPLELLALEPDLRVAGVERLGHRALLVEVAVGARVPHDHGARRRSPRRSRPRSRRSRAGGPRPRRRGASRAGRSTGPSGPPTSAASRRPRGGSRSAALEASCFWMTKRGAPRPRGPRLGASSPRTPGSGVLSGSRLRR